MDEIHVEAVLYLDGNRYGNADYCPGDSFRTDVKVWKYKYCSKYQQLQYGNGGCDSFDYHARFNRIMQKPPLFCIIGSNNNSRRYYSRTR